MAFLLEEVYQLAVVEPYLLHEVAVIDIEAFLVLLAKAVCQEQGMVHQFRLVRRHASWEVVESHST